MTRKQILLGVIVLALLLLGGGAYYVFFLPAANDSAAPVLPAASAVNGGDHTLGSPRAPVTLIEYAAPTCPHCAHFDMDVFPALKQRYIDTGKVFFVFRVFPLGAVDVAAESMARCLPKDHYFSFIDFLYRNQSRWDPDGYDIPDVHAALLQMGNVAGLTAPQTDRCIADQAQAQAIEGVGTEAQNQFGIHQTPSFVIRGTVYNFLTLDDVAAAIDPLLKGK